MHMAPACASGPEGLQLAAAHAGPRKALRNSLHAVGHKRHFHIQAVPGRDFVGSYATESLSTS